MTDTHDGESPRDESLRERLHAADPAASLPPADPAWVARLLEDTMTDTLTDESRTDGTRNRSRLTWLVAAAAVVLIAGGFAFVFLGGGDDEPDQTAGDPGSSASSQDAGPVNDPGTAIELGFDEAATSGRCVAPDSAAALQVLKGQDVAFDGTVESVSGGRVTLTPERFYAGEEADLVVVRAPGPDLQALLSAVQFREGGRYLVSASQGTVSLCGLSAPYDDALAAQYEKAFG